MTSCDEKIKTMCNSSIITDEQMAEFEACSKVMTDFRTNAEVILCRLEVIYTCKLNFPSELYGEPFQLHLLGCRSQ